MYPRRGGLSGIAGTATSVSNRPGLLDRGAGLSESVEPRALRPNLHADSRARPSPNTSLMGLSPRRVLCSDSVGVWFSIDPRVADLGTCCDAPVVVAVFGSSALCFRAYEAESESRLSLYDLRLNGFGPLDVARALRSAFCRLRKFVERAGAEGECSSLSSVTRRTGGTLRISPAATLLSVKFADPLDPPDLQLGVTGDDNLHWRCAEGPLAAAADWRAGGCQLSRLSLIPLEPLGPSGPAGDSSSTGGDKMDSFAPPSPLDNGLIPLGRRRGSTSDGALLGAPTGLQLAMPTLNHLQRYKTYQAQAWDSAEQTSHGQKDSTQTAAAPSGPTQSWTAATRLYQPWPPPDSAYT